MSAPWYPHAPILEAILDIQVQFSTLPSQALFDQFAKDLSATFTQSTNLGQFQLNVGVSVPPGDPAVAHTVGIVGLRLATSQNDRVLQIQPRGLSFSHLPPYTNWAIFKAEVVPLWKRYLEVLRPESVTRVALRYINRIYIPGETFEMSDYFNLYPNLPENVPQDLSSLFMQVQMPQSDLGKDVTAVVNCSTAGRREDGAQGIMLDFDVFATRSVRPTVEDVFSLLDELRERKNKLFEASITDRSRELFR